MNRFRWVLQILIPSCLVGFLSLQGYSQKPDTARKISVTLNIIGYGSTDYFKEKEAGYFAMATVTNNEDTAISFVIMECSWARDNWVASNNSIFFGDRGCDANSPIRIKLLPHKSINFYGVIRIVNKGAANKKIRLGFLYYTSFNNLLDAKSKSYRKYWSNDVNLEDNLFKYRQD
jgi:hypothetical protein